MQDREDLVRSLFLEAMELPAADRDHLLQRRCGDDAELFADVRSLLTQSIEGFLESGAAVPTAARGVVRRASPSPENARSQTGRSQMGRYPIDRELGRGGMGIVYLGRDPSLEREIAIKLLPVDLMRDPDRRARLVREAQLLAAINHPNIATVYSLEEEDDTVFITLEYLLGVSLAEQLGKEQFEIEPALDIGRQIALALEAAHAASIVHRDLKPSNVQWLPDRRVKVLDFGLALDARKLPGDEGVAGTPGYMSPEQCVGEPVGPSADVWAFGCVLYECLTGSRAFPATLDARLVSQWDDALLPAETPAPIRSLIAECLQVDPAERPRDGQEVRRRLDEVLARRAVNRAGITGAIPSRAITNLGPPLTPFIGRKRELDEVQETIVASRMVTITGPGGVGKTRIAYEAARQVGGFPDGVWVIELAALRDPQHIAVEALAVLGISEEPGVAPAEQLARSLRASDALLVLDNAEHLASHCRELVNLLLRACSFLRVVVTSREPIHAVGERVFSLGPMSAPPVTTTTSLEQVVSSDAGRLFVDRARRADASAQFVDSEAAAIAEICRRVDGLPLAVELAAARARVLSPSEIAKRLDRALEFLSDPQSAEARHRTVRELIDWSHDQLTEAEQRLFARLAFFDGSWTLELAESVCTDESLQTHEVLDTLTSLIDKSLVHCVKTEDRRDRTRYRMLDLVRQYGRDCLNNDGLEHGTNASAIRVAHRDAILRFAEEAGAHLLGTDQGEWLLRVAEDHDQIRQAVGGTLIDSDAPAVGLRIVTALERYWIVRAHASEASDWLRQLLDAYREPSRLRAIGLHFAGILAKQETRYDLAGGLLEEALAIERQAGDPGRVASVLQAVASIRTDQGDAEGALSALEEVLSTRRAQESPRGVALTLVTIGRTLVSQGDRERAIPVFEESLEISTQIGDEYLIAAVLDNIGLLDLYAERYASARSRFEQARALNEKSGNRSWMAKNVTHLGIVAKREAKFREARTYYQRSLDILIQLEDRHGVLESIRAFAHLSAELDEHEVSAKLLGATDSLSSALSVAPSESERQMIHASRHRIRLALGDERASEARRAGAILTLEQAADLALRSSGSSLAPDFRGT